MRHAVRRVLVWIALALLWTFAPRAAAATLTPINTVEAVDFDRPEAWAMKYYSSATLLTGLGTPRPLKLWSVRVGLEGDWIPYVSEAQTHVGFNGTKAEDLNKVPVNARLRVTVGLPWRFSLTLSYQPPIEINGVRPNLFALALGRPFRISRNFVIGLQATGQVGYLDGDFTCPLSAVKAGLDPIQNPFDCLEKSHDRLEINTFGVEASASYRIAALHGLEPYATASFHYMDLGFHVNARYGEVIDTTQLKTRGVTFATTGGLLLPITRRLDLVGEVFYSPITVKRPEQAGRTVEGLLNVRGMVAYRFN